MVGELVSRPATYPLGQLTPEFGDLAEYAVRTQALQPINCLMAELYCPFRIP